MTRFLGSVALCLLLAGCGGSRSPYTPPVPTVPTVPTPIDVGLSMFGTVDLLVGGNVHVKDYILRPPNIPSEYAAFVVLYVRVTYAKEGITQLRSIFGKKCETCKIEVAAEEKWDHPPQGMIEVQTYFVEAGSGIGVVYFPATLLPGEQANFSGTGKWSWGLTHDEPLASGTFTYSLVVTAGADRSLALEEKYDYPKFHRRYTFKNGMESLTDLGQPSIAGVLVNRAVWKEDGTIMAVKP